MTPSKNAQLEDDIRFLMLIIKDTFWMARRYAHGRHAGSPSTIRNIYQLLKERFPELVPRKDDTLEPPDDSLSGFALRSDWLDDCND